jgi:hypothetical protein
MTTINRSNDLGRIQPDLPEPENEAPVGLAKTIPAGPSHHGDGLALEPGEDHPFLAHGGDGLTLGGRAPLPIYADEPAKPLPPAAPPPKEDPPNPLAPKDPPPIPPSDSKFPDPPNPYPYVEKTPGGGIVGIKGKF